MKKPYVLSLPILLLAGSAFAAEPPDAGTLLREQPKTPAAKPAPFTPPTPAATQAPKEKDAGPVVLVKSFRVTGSSLIANNELVAQLGEYVGKEYSFRQLQSLALHLVGYYAQKGYLARIFIAPQDFADGAVTFTVIEGKLGTLKFDTQIDASRIDAARAQRFISGRLRPGEPFSLTAVGEAMTILNEQPGIQARSALKPGTGEGEIDLVVTATDTPLTVYSLKVDNNATQATGKNQIGASVSLQNPSGRFDQATLFANASDGVTFVNADYSLAVGERGLRAGASASSLRYRITETSFDALRGDGSASILSAYFSYPLQRLAQRSLTVNASLAQKRMTDYAFDQETGNRNLNVGNVGLSGWSVNPWIGGITSYGAELTAGSVDRAANAADMAQDQKGRRTDGRFTKLAWRIGQTVSVAEGWNVLANLRGQVAERNLDSSERLSLGGPANVRAYSVDEAAGDEGYLLSLNLLHPINETLAAKLFFDYGEITLNKNLWDNWNVGNPGLPNRYALKGIGAGLDWMVAKNTSLSVMLAAPLGDNPGRDSNELDPNAGRKQARFSASLLVNF